MSPYYIIKDRIVTETESVYEWAKNFESPDRQIKQTSLPNNVRVSTVFLGLDHAFKPGATPILFETMIFGGPHDGYQERYSTIEQAEDGHALAVKMGSERDVNK